MKQEILECPRNLIFQLEIFRNDAHGTKKIDTPAYPEYLDMKPYISGLQKDSKTKYRLYAVSNQNGNLCSGHYIAQIRVRDPKNPENDKGWFEFNDEIVRKSSETRALSDNAYILFYERL